MKNKIFVWLGLIIFVLILVMGCTDKYQPAPSHFASAESGCVSCHTNANTLKQVATPLPPPSGEAGEG